LTLPTSAKTKEREVLRQHFRDGDVAVVFYSNGPEAFASFTRCSETPWWESLLLPSDARESLPAAELASLQTVFEKDSGALQAIFLHAAAVEVAAEAAMHGIELRAPR